MRAMNIIEELENEQLAKLTSDRKLPEFHPGDTIRVSVKVIEGTRERLQAFEGVCIARKNDGLNSSFTVRKLSSGEGVERVFPLHSPNVAEIEVVRRGDVRRAKLYYLRGRTGKRARIAEQTDGYKAKITADEKAIAAKAKSELKKKSKGKAEAKAEKKAAKKAAPAPAAEKAASEE